MYFAWLGMYTKWLIAPAGLGIITFFLSNRGEVTRDWCILFFNIFNIVWATLFLEAWKRKSAELAYKWGTMDMPSDALKEPRPLFRVCCLKRIVHSRESLFSSNFFKACLLFLGQNCPEAVIILCHMHKFFRFSVILFSKSYSPLSIS